MAYHKVVIFLCINLANFIATLPHDYKDNQQKDSGFSIPFIDFQNGKVEVKFGPWKAGAGLGGNPNEAGRLWANAGSVNGPAASAGLGGYVKGDKHTVAEVGSKGFEASQVRNNEGGSVMGLGLLGFSGITTLLKRLKGGNAGLDGSTSNGGNENYSGAGQTGGSGAFQSTYGGGSQGSGQFGGSSIKPGYFGGGGGSQGASISGHFDGNIGKPDILNGVLSNVGLQASNVLSSWEQLASNILKPGLGQGSFGSGVGGSQGSFGNGPNNGAGGSQGPYGGGSYVSPTNAGSQGSQGGGAIGSSGISSSGNFGVNFPKPEIISGLFGGGGSQGSPGISTSGYLNGNIGTPNLGFGSSGGAGGGSQPSLGVSPSDQFVNGQPSASHGSYGSSTGNNGGISGGSQSSGLSGHWSSSFGKPGLTQGTFGGVAGGNLGLSSLSNLGSNIVKPGFLGGSFGLGGDGTHGSLTGGIGGSYGSLGGGISTGQNSGSYGSPNTGPIASQPSYGTPAGANSPLNWSPNHSGIGPQSSHVSPSIPHGPPFGSQNSYGSPGGGNNQPQGSYGSSNGGSSSPQAPPSGSSTGTQGSYGSSGSGSGDPQGSYGSPNSGSPQAPSSGSSTGPQGPYGSSGSGSSDPQGSYGSPDGGSSSPQLPSTGSPTGTQGSYGSSGSDPQGSYGSPNSGSPQALPSGSSTGPQGPYGSSGSGSSDPQGSYGSPNSGSPQALPSGSSTGPQGPYGSSGSGSSDPQGSYGSPNSGSPQAPSSGSSTGPQGSYGSSSNGGSYGSPSGSTGSSGPPSGGINPYASSNIGHGGGNLKRIHKPYGSPGAALQWSFGVGSGGMQGSSSGVDHGSQASTGLLSGSFNANVVKPQKPYKPQFGSPNSHWGAQGNPQPHQQTSGYGHGSNGGLAGGWNGNGGSQSTNNPSLQHGSTGSSHHAGTGGSFAHGPTGINHHAGSSGANQVGASQGYEDNQGTVSEDYYHPHTGNNGVDGHLGNIHGSSSEQQPPTPGYSAHTWNGGHGTIGDGLKENPAMPLYGAQYGNVNTGHEVRAGQSGDHQGSTFSALGDNAHASAGVPILDSGVTPFGSQEIGVRVLRPPSTRVTRSTKEKGGGLNAGASVGNGGPYAGAGLGGFIGSKDDGGGVLFAAASPGNLNSKKTKDRTNIQVILPNQKLGERNIVGHDRYNNVPAESAPESSISAISHRETRQNPNEEERPIASAFPAVLHPEDDPVKSIEKIKISNGKVEIIEKSPTPTSSTLDISHQHGSTNATPDIETITVEKKPRWYFRKRLRPTRKNVIYRSAEDTDTQVSSSSNSGFTTGILARSEKDGTETPVTRYKGESFFDDIFNIPISTLKAVNELLNKNLG